MPNRPPTTVFPAKTMLWMFPGSESAPLPMAKPAVVLPAGTAPASVKFLQTLPVTATFWNTTR